MAGDLDQQLDDEALARALQDEFSREYVGRQARTSASHPTTRLPPSSNNVIVPGLPLNASASPEASSARPINGNGRRSVSRNGSAHGVSARTRTPSSARQVLPVPHSLTPASATTNRTSSQRQRTIESTLPPQLVQTTAETDEEFARRLERTFQQEESALQSGFVPSTRNETGRRTVNSPSYPPVQTDEEYSRRLEQSLFQNGAVMGVNEANDSRTLSNLSPADRDAEVARELQRAIDMEEAAHRQKRKSDTPLTSRTNSESSSEHPISDYDLARKMEQELMDEQIARQLASADEERMAQAQARRAAGHGAQTRSCSPKRALTFLVPMILVRS
jgi:hypothetical protein